jgi:hypothetical protein
MHRFTAAIFQLSGFHRVFRNLVLVFALFPLVQVHAATFTVTNLLNSGAGSFRTALTSANASPGLDNIVFSVSGTINIVGGLPQITSPVNINGTTAPGYVACGMPMIVLNGAASGSNGLQLVAGGSGSTIQALNIRSFPFNAIQLIGSSNNTIRACYIGTTQNGNAAAGNGQNAIQVELSSNNNLFGGPNACDRNIIAANTGAGVSIVSSNFNTISNNYIGVSASGTLDLGNNSVGVFMCCGSNNNIIGGSTLNERNIISNNGTGISANGIDINGCSNITIRNNYVGLNAAGTAAMGNAENGIILIGTPNSTIGGVGTFDGNVIAGHNFHGIVLVNGANNVNVYGNRIGTNAAGTAALGNDDSGVIVINCSNVNVGGIVAEQANLLSGSLSEYGVYITGSTGVNVRGNKIGTNLAGTGPLPNFGGGVLIENNSNLNTIGGTAAGAANIIAFNTGFGVGVLTNNSTRNLISRNSMFCNTGKGIELNGLGNSNHPSPVIGTFTAAGAAGTAQPNDIIELFYDSTCTPTCQGKDFIAQVSANALGNWTYVGPLNTSERLVAIAIRTTVPLANNTSEATCQVILPVEWASFEATRGAGQSVNLDWETAVEAGLSHFEVERSTSGLPFEVIGQVIAKNTSTGAPYLFTDPLARPGSNVYRLRQVDQNGAFSYSETREIILDDSPFQLQTGSNPANQEIRFRVTGEQVSGLRYSLVNLSGQEMAGASLDAAQQRGWISISSTDLPAGIYYLRVIGSGYQAAKKMVVVH